jgi:hypothetical protein
MEESEVKNGSLLIVPHSFTQRNDITMTSNLQDTADDIQKIINADIEDIKCSDPGMVEGLIIGILGPSGSINWVYKPKSNDNKRISLLSLDLKDVDEEGHGIINLDSALFPVLAATADFPNSKAKISLDIYDSVTNDVLGGVETDGQISTGGLFTIVWKEFDLSEVLGSDYRRLLKDGSVAIVHVSLSNNGEDRNLIQKYKILLPQVIPAKIKKTGLIVSVTSWQDSQEVPTSLRGKKIRGSKSTRFDSTQIIYKFSFYELLLPLLFFWKEQVAYSLLWWLFVKIWIYVVALFLIRLIFLYPDSVNISPRILPYTSYLPGDLRT